MLIKKPCFPFIIFLLSSPLWATQAKPPLNDTSIAKELSASPNDINQLLSLLKQEKYSLIKRTVATPFFDQFQADVKKLKDKYGIDFGINYIPLLEYSEAGRPKDNASGANFEFFGRYMPQSWQRTKTIFAIKLDDNHEYSSIAPGNFSGQLNSTIKTTSGYVPYNLAVTELWIQQSIIPDVVAYRLGKIDLTSMMNSYAFDSRRFFFLSDVFSRHPATAVPAKSLGAVVGFALSKHLYSAVGIVNAEGTEITSGFSTVFKGHYFTSVELGYRDVITNPQSDNYHVFLWHVDSRPEQAKPGGQGISVVLQKNIQNRLIPFIKLDWSTGEAAAFNKLFITGVGLEHPFHGYFGLLGVAGGYAELAEQKGTNQWIVETFYRLQLTPHSQLTPDVELIKPVSAKGFHRIATVFNLRYNVSI